VTTSENVESALPGAPSRGRALRLFSISRRAGPQARVSFRAHTFLALFAHQQVCCATQHTKKFDGRDAADDRAMEDGDARDERV